LTFDRSFTLRFTWLTLFSLLPLTFHPSPAWPEEDSLESVSFHLREKPIEIPSEEASLDTLEHTRKLNRFKDSFIRFFQEMSRNLGSLLFPQGESAGASALSVSSSAGSGIASSSVIAGPAIPAKMGTVPAVSGTVPIFSHSFDLPAARLPDGQGRQGDIHPFEPLDLDSLRPVNFSERLAKLFPASYPLETLKNSFALSPLNLFGNLSFSPEALLPVLQTLPSIPASSLAELPVRLRDSFNAPSLEKPILYSDWKGESLRRSDPFSQDPATVSPLPLLVNPELLLSNPAVILSEAKNLKPEILRPDGTQDDTVSFSSSFRHPSHTPLVWDALEVRYKNRKGDNKVRSIFRNKKRGK